MKIVLCCAGGFSTTMLMESMKKTVRDSQKLNEADFEFLAIPVDILEQNIDNTDVLLIGPQIAHKLDAILPITQPRNIPHVVIDKDTYGSMDGATTLKMALIAKRKNEMEK